MIKEPFDLGYDKRTKAFGGIYGASKRYDLLGVFWSTNKGYMLANQEDF
jgi:hypothetical protein